jgi:hypothetical protein
VQLQAAFPDSFSSCVSPLLALINDHFKWSLTLAMSTFHAGYAQPTQRELLYPTVGPASFPRLKECVYFVMQRCKR